MYDKLEDVEKEFPKDKYTWIPIKNEDEGTHAFASLCLKSHQPIFGETRWFSESDGVMIITSNLNKNSVKQVRTFSFLKKIFIKFLVLISIPFIIIYTLIRHPIICFQEFKKEFSSGN